MILNYFDWIIHLNHFYWYYVIPISTKEKLRVTYDYRYWYNPQITTDTFSFKFIFCRISGQMGGSQVAQSITCSPAKQLLQNVKRGINSLLSISKGTWTNLLPLCFEYYIMVYWDLFWGLLCHPKYIEI